MKKFILLFFFPALVFSQISAGKYMIKQSGTNFSVKSVENSPEFTRIEQPCVNPSTNCSNQIFDIVNVDGNYTINVSGKNLFLTFEGPSDNMMRFKAKQASRQLFSIVDNGNGSFFIKPKLENNTNYYIGTRMDLYLDYGSELQFLVKERSRMPREYNDFRNVSWTFFPITNVKYLQPAIQNLKLIKPGKIIISK